MFAITNAAVLYQKASSRDLSAQVFWKWSEIPALEGDNDAGHGWVEKRVPKMGSKMVVLHGFTMQNAVFSMILDVEMDGTYGNGMTWIQ